MFDSFVCAIPGVITNGLATGAIRVLAGPKKTKQAFDVEVDDHDGAFWMSDTDFLKHFSCVDVAFFDRSWATARTKLTSTGASMCNQLLRFEVKTAARGFVSLLQNDHRIKGLSLCEGLH